jgi:WD40 repeat protein
MEVPSINVEGCYSYNGGKLLALDEDNVAHSSGNGLRILSLSSGSNAFLWNDHEPAGRRSGLSALAFCAESKQIAIAPRAIDPVVLVYTYPGKRLERTFPSGTKLCYNDIAFSRNGKYLAAIGDSPDYTIIVWDVFTGSIVVSSKLPQACNFVSFNPLDETKIVAGGEKGLFMYTLSTNVDGVSMSYIEVTPPVEEDDMDEPYSEDDDDEGIDSPPGSPKGSNGGGRAVENAEDIHGPRKDFTCHCWGKDNTVYASARCGTVSMFSHSSGEAVKVAAAVYLDNDTGVDDAAVKVGADVLVLIRDNLIAGYADSQIRYLHPTTLEVERELGVGSYNLVYTGRNDGAAEQNVHSLQPLSSALTPKFSTLVLGTAGGHLISLSLGVEEEDEDGMGEEETVTQLHGEMHAEPVYASSVVVGAPVPILLNGSVDGSLRVWNSSRRTLIETKTFPSSIFLCAGNSPNRPLAAFGTMDGILRVFYVSGTAEKVDVKTIYRCKLAATAVSSICFHPSKPLLAVVVIRDRRIFFLDYRADEKIRIIGVSELDEGIAPNTIAWRGTEGMELLVGTHSGDLLEIVAPAPAIKGDLTYLANANVPKRDLAALGIQPISILATGEVDGSQQNLFVASADTKNWCQYTLKSATRKLQMQPSTKLSCHERGILCTAVHNVDPETQLVVTGGQDGAICIWTLKTSGNTTSASLMSTNSYHGVPIVSVVFNEDGTRIFSGSADGTFFAWKVERKRRSASMTVISDGYAAMEGIVEPSEAERRVELTYMGRLKKIADDRAAEEHERAKKKRLADLGDIREELQTLLLQNERVPDLEKMDRDEFVIDLQWKESMLEEGKKRAQELRQKLEKENLKMDLIADRLKAEVWDSMEEKTKALYAFVGDDCIYNIGIPAVTVEERTLLEKLVHLRRCELRSIRAANGNKTSREWEDLSKLLPKTGEQMDWLVNEGVMAPSAEVKERKSEEEKAAEAKEAEEKVEGEEEEEEEQDEIAEENDAGDDDLRDATEPFTDLIYPPLALRTPAQKRMQIVFLKELIRLMKKSFDSKFEEMYAMKQECFEKITTRNNRIKEILSELKITSEFFKPTWHDEEFPEKFATVTDEEMPIERYVTEAERERIAEEEEAKRLRGLANDTDNAPQRALNDMMNGTIEVAAELNALEIELVREEWMDELLYEEMSDEQRKLVEDFEAKQKALTEEKEKYRKGLELELKKIKGEVSEICASHDDKLKAFRQVKTRYQEAILTQELYCLRLSLLLLEKEDDASQMKILRAELVRFGEDFKVAESKRSSFQIIVEKSKNELEVLRNKDRQMEKDFKRAVQEKAPNGMLDHDTLNVLGQLYKSRPVVADGDLSKDPSLTMASSAMMSNDPFAEDLAIQIATLPEKQIVAAREAAMQPLDLENEMPEGFEVDVAVLSGVQKQRMKKIEVECDIREKLDEVKKLQVRESELTFAANSLSQKVAETEASIAELEERIAFNAINHEVLISIKQGFVEVPQEAVVTDYTDACLINRNIVSERNERIRELGGGKIAVLESIKDFNKKINLMKWETNYLKMMESNMEEKYMDLHMLRVTKDLQSFLKGGANVDRHKVDYEKAEKKMVYIQKNHTLNLAKIMKAKALKEKEVAQKEAENKRLAAHVAELEKNVAVRASIHRARASGGDGVADPNAAGHARMKAIVTRRKLLDLARAQTDEIEFLRQELDRLRQKTFPSFATRRNPNINPDDAEQY